MNHDCECEYHCDDCCCEKKQEKLNAAVLRCGSPGYVSFANLTGVEITRTIATLQINTSGFEHPCILLGSYRFQIFKECSDKMALIPVSGIYVYSRSVATTVSDTFSFNVCDCDSCMNDCCTYLAVVTFNVSPVIGGATLSAIVTENGCDN